MFLFSSMVIFVDRFHGLNTTPSVHMSECADFFFVVLVFCFIYAKYIAEQREKKRRNKIATQTLCCLMIITTVCVFCCLRFNTRVCIKKIYIFFGFIDAPWRNSTWYAKTG